MVTGRSWDGQFVRRSTVTCLTSEGGESHQGRPVNVLARVEVVVQVSTVASDVHLGPCGRPHSGPSCLTVPGSSKQQFVLRDIVKLQPLMSLRVGDKVGLHPSLADEDQLQTSQEPRVTDRPWEHNTSDLFLSCRDLVLNISLRSESESPVDCLRLRRNPDVLGQDEGG